MFTNQARSILFVKTGTDALPAGFLIFEQNGFQTFECSDLEKAKEYLDERKDIQLVLLELTETNTEGIIPFSNEVSQNYQVPVFFYTEEISEYLFGEVSRATRHCILNKNSSGLFLLSTIESCLVIHEHLSEGDRQLKELCSTNETLKHKINSILIPETEALDLELRDVIDVEAIQDLMDSFYEITKVGVAIVDNMGNILVATGWQEVCTKFHRQHPIAGKHCMESDTMLSSDILPGTFKIYKCKNHMWDMATPIMAGNKKIGNVFLGQFFFEDEIPEYRSLMQNAKTYGFDIDEYIAALDKVPRWSRHLVDSVMQFYTKLTKLLSQLSYGNIRLRKALDDRNRMMHQHKIDEFQYRDLVDRMQEGVLVVDNDDIIQYVNPMFCKVLGYDKLELIGRIGYEILILPEDREKIIQKNKEREQKVNDQYEMIMLNKSGEKVLFSLKASPIEDFAGTVIGSMAICMDITEQKRNEAKIRNLLKEKDVLLREVHHRIKNNMSTIRAMLAFQANTINLPEAEVALNEAENRIMSMMMIYNKLYRSQDYSKINANEYLSELVKEISSTLNHKHNIQVELSIENIVLNSEILYPLGIIVNELVTNSYKYAFPDQKQGQILINLRTKENGKMELLYADNGIGIPECRLAEKKEGFGLSLIELLVDQISGSSELRTENGMCFKIVF